MKEPFLHYVACKASAYCIGNLTYNATVQRNLQLHYCTPIYWAVHERNFSVHAKFLRVHLTKTAINKSQTLQIIPNMGFSLHVHLKLQVTSMIAFLKASRYRWLKLIARKPKTQHATLPFHENVSHFNKLCGPWAPKRFWLCSIPGV